ncbi:MAG: hypothetical protein ACREMA_08445 [Longimicrobiales bacterium]
MLAAACVKPTASTAPGNAEPEAPAARPLSYAQPATPTLVYEFADSSVSDIQAGAAGALRVSTGGSGTAELKFEPGGSDQRITMVFRQFAGTFSNSAGGGPVSATAADIKGPVILSVTPRGVVKVVQKPEMTQAFRQVSGSDTVFFQRFFVRLPARSVRPGATWTDTIANIDNIEGLTIRVQNIARSTYARDTVVAGHTFNVITVETERTYTVSGTTQGVEIVQRLKGTANSVTLWDPEKRAVFSRSETATMTGAMDLPAMSMTNMPMSATLRNVLQLKE